MVIEERLKEIRQQLKKDLKLNIDFANSDKFVVERISTGNLVLDDILGGGVPRRGISIIYGLFSVGKSWITLRAIAEAQNKGLLCAIIDTEYAFDPDWAKINGVNTDELMISQPTHGEQALETAIALCKQKVDLLIIDSIAALLPKDEDDPICSVAEDVGAPGEQPPNPTTETNP